MDDLDVLVRQARKDADREAAEAAVVGRQGKAARAEAERLRAQLELHEKVLGVLTSVGEARQESAQRQVEGLVTRALQVVFDENLSFHLVPSVKANRAEIDFVLRSVNRTANDTGEIVWEQMVDTPVLEARGGGMAAVVGFVLRLVVLLLTPGARRILCLDESFGMVSKSYEPRVADFLREVADKAAVQIVLITHSDAYSDAADRRYLLSLGPDGITQVTEGEAET
jgi:predicted ABC-type transport system involved in lysophospholipase L1 biosynthesis ATPase subunit